jgi:hypothetical protein
MNAAWIFHYSLFIYVHLKDDHTLYADPKMQKHLNKVPNIDTELHKSINR